MTSYACSARHHIVFSLNSSWLSRSWMSIHEIGPIIWERNMPPSCLELPKNICFAFRPNREEQDIQLWYMGIWSSGQSFLSFKDYWSTKMPALSFQLATIIGSQQTASLILLHFNAQEKSPLETARKTWSKSFYEEQLNNPSRTFHQQYYKPSFLFISRNGGKSRGKGIVIMSQISKSISWTSVRPWIFSKLIDHQILTLYICITLQIIKLFGVFCYLKERLCGHNALRGPVPFQKLFRIHKKKQDYLLCLCLALPPKKLKGLCIVLLVLIRENGDRLYVSSWLREILDFLLSLSVCSPTVHLIKFLREVHSFKFFVNLFFKSFNKYWLKIMPDTAQGWRYQEKKSFRSQNVYRLVWGTSNTEVNKW